MNVGFYFTVKKAEDELKRLEELDIIEKVDGPTPWVSPIVVAPKPKNPDEIRICVDMCLPNKAVKRERHITPTIDDIIVELTGAKVFSKLDLNSGYQTTIGDTHGVGPSTFSIISSSSSLFNSSSTFFLK
jgi:hypothetical protein